MKMFSDEHFMALLMAAFWPLFFIFIIKGTLATARKAIRHFRINSCYNFSFYYFTQINLQSIEALKRKQYTLIVEVSPCPFMAHEFRGTFFVGRLFRRPND